MKSEVKDRNFCLFLYIQKISFLNILTYSVRYVTVCRLPVNSNTQSLRMTE